MPIESIQFTDAGPFREIEFDLDPHVNVLIGPNNTGKTTALWVLGELLVYPFTMPSKMLRSEAAHWEMRYRGLHGDTATLKGRLPIVSAPSLIDAYQKIGYTCFVPAQRYSSDFRSFGPNIGDDVDADVEAEIEAFAQSRPEIARVNDRSYLRQALRNQRGSEHPELAKRRGLMLTGASLATDEAIIQKIINLDYDSYRLGRPDIKQVVEYIGSVASEVTEGFPLSFAGVGKDERGLFANLNTPDGELPLDNLSQGTQSVIHCIARFILGYAEYYDFPADLSDKPAILIIDEIDAHLHPAWQRRIIPALTRHFNSLQIVCAAHSPLVLTGLDRGQVQLLTRNDAGGVTVTANETDIVGWTSDEILRNIFEVTYPTDIGTVRRVNRLGELESLENLSDEQAVELESLRETVALDIHRGPGSVIVERFAEELRRARHGNSLGGSPHER